MFCSPDLVLQLICDGTMFSGMHYLPIPVIKGIWLSVGAGASYAGYRILQKDLWAGARRVAEAHGTLPEQQLPAQPETLFGPAARTTLAVQWNQLVDASIGRLAQELGKRGI